MWLESSIVKGIITGFLLSLPFGPVGIYCMEVTIVEGGWKGYTSALGMVSIDIFYSLLAILFLNKVDFLIIQYQKTLTIMIGIFLILIALKKLRNPVQIKEVRREFNTLLQGYFTFLLFSLANISTLALIILIFTALRIFDNTSPGMLVQVLFGVFLGGSFLWFTTTKILSKLRKKIQEKTIVKISRSVSLFILLAGIYLLVKTIFNFK